MSLCLADGRHKVSNSKTMAYIYEAFCTVFTYRSHLILLTAFSVREGTLPASFYRRINMPVNKCKTNDGISKSSFGN